MMSIRVVTDSTCDLPQEIIDRLQITEIPLYVNVGERSYLDRVELQRAAFYRRLGDFPQHPTTATPGVDAFRAVYQQLAEEGANAILSLHISETLSATVNIARQAAASFAAIPVEVIDSQQLSLGTGFQVERAAALAAAGASVKEIKSALNGMRPQIFVAAALDTLKFLRRSGRMSALMSGLGSLLQLKPTLTMVNGEAGSIRVRTARGAEQRLVEMLEKHQPLERIALLHAGAADAAKAFQSRWAKLLQPLHDPLMQITPVIGAHIGPGAFGYAQIARHPIKS